MLRDETRFRTFVTCGLGDCQKFKRWTVSALLAMIGWLATAGFAAESKPGLSVGAHGELLSGSKPFRGIGVNYFDAFVRLLGNGKLREVEAGFRVLASNQIPFIRFAAGGYWPVDWGLYQTNRQEYFNRLNGVVTLAERHGIGLIPSLFWHQPTISDLVGEPVSEWGNPASKTQAFMRDYTRELVTRYRQSPAIWAWEFGNEFNLAADLPNAAEHRPPTHTALGTAATRSARDDLKHADLRCALAEFAREVRRYDAHRLILSGNAFPRDSAWHQMREQSWANDSSAQWSEMLSQDNPPPLDSFSGRLYSTNDLAHLASAMALARQTGVPLVIGEFGVAGAMTAANEELFHRWLVALDTNRVPLAALWVFDFKQQPDWNVFADNHRAEQLRQVADMNRLWRQENRAK